MGRLARRIADGGAHAARSVVLLPYAQLMPVARAAWATRVPDGFSPRFETTMNWAGSAGFVPADHDLAFDIGRDLLTGRAWLERAGLGAQADLLAGRVVEAVRQLAGIAAARAPADRAAWLVQARAIVGAGQDNPALQLEAAIARIAAEWAAASGYAGDVLFDAALLADVDLLVVIEGFQADPLARALAARWDGRAEVWPFPLPAARGAITLQAAGDAADEAERAAACVLRHLEAGRTPVALAATDRVLTRRILALLDARGAAVRDETGWKLSTSRVAADAMAALRACAWDASSDEVLDWLKNSPALPSGRVHGLERRLRQLGVRDWRAVQPEAAGEAMAALVRDVNRWREPLVRARPLAQWLAAWRHLLQDCGQWNALQRDVAGVRMQEALRLAEGGDSEFHMLPQAAPRMELHDFTGWANEVLESVSFTPERSGGEAVLVLPFEQLLGRDIAAVVFPGCDEVRLPAAPEPAGAWTSAQREALGLPSRETLQREQRAAWTYALGAPHCDLLWRRGDDDGEPVLASPLIEQLRLDGVGEAAADPREVRSVLAQPVARPRPVAPRLPLAQLSASSYEDLRRCPYRFFALRQLGLKEADEIDEELGKRDFGSWLHAVLRGFHEAVQAAGDATREERIALMDEQARRLLREQGLDEGEFLPFLAGWPTLRDGYLTWLAKHEAQGFRFEAAETEREVALGALTLKGRLDRIDRQTHGTVLVMDYKTESAKATQDRMKQPLEDTQLAFYAVLLGDPQLQAAYLNVSERGDVKAVPHSDLLRARDLLVAAIEADMRRIGAGESLPALGEGAACEYCAARGMCRKDSWDE